MSEFFALLLNVLPYLVVAVALTVAGTRYFREKQLLHFSRNEFLSIGMAAMVGLVSPLPTYTAVPLGLSFLTNGLPLSAVLAFVISSPLMNPTIFFLTTTQIGFEMAMARVTTAFLLGFLGGTFSMKIFKAYVLPKNFSEHTFSPQSRPLFRDIVRTSMFFGKYFSIALFLSAVIKALIPADDIAALVGNNAPAGTLIAMGLGIPLYSCGGAAIPLMETLRELGMNKGAILAFFIAGPATKIETLYAFKSMLGTKVLVFYLLLTLVCAYIAGTVYSLLG